MKYHLTIEKTLSMGITFEASDDDAAEEIAQKIFDDVSNHPEILEDGYAEYDYALTDECYRDIVPWS